MDNRLKTDNENYMRDQATNALINTNVAAYKQYLLQRDSQKKVTTIETEVENLKKDVTDIKDMLMLLIKQTNKEN